MVQYCLEMLCDCDYLSDISQCVRSSDAQAEFFQICKRCSAGISFRSRRFLHCTSLTLFPLFVRFPRMYTIPLYAVWLTPWDWRLFWSRTFNQNPYCINLRCCSCRAQSGREGGHSRQHLVCVVLSYREKSKLCWSILLIWTWNLMTRSNAKGSL